MDMTVEELRKQIREMKGPQEFKAMLGQISQEQANQITDKQFNTLFTEAAKRKDMGTVLDFVEKNGLNGKIPEKCKNKLWKMVDVLAKDPRYTADAQRLSDRVEGVLKTKKPVEQSQTQTQSNTADKDKIAELEAENKKLKAQLKKERSKNGPQVANEKTAKETAKESTQTIDKERKVGERAKQHSDKGMFDDLSAELSAEMAKMGKGLYDMNQHQQIRKDNTAGFTPTYAPSMMMPNMGMMPGMMPGMGMGMPGMMPGMGMGMPMMNPYMAGMMPFMNPYMMNPQMNAQHMYAMLQNYGLSAEQIGTINQQVGTFMDQNTAADKTTDGYSQRALDNLANSFDKVPLDKLWDQYHAMDEKTDPEAARHLYKYLMERGDAEVKSEQETAKKAESDEKAKAAKAKYKEADSQKRKEAYEKQETEKQEAAAFEQDFQKSLDEQYKDMDLDALWKEYEEISQDDPEMGRHMYKYFTDRSHTQAMEEKQAEAKEKYQQEQRQQRVDAREKEAQGKEIYNEHVDPQSEVDKIVAQAKAEQEAKAILDGQTAQSQIDSYIDAEVAAEDARYKGPALSEQMEALQWAEAQALVNSKKALGEQTAAYRALEAAQQTGDKAAIKEAQKAFVAASANYKDASNAATEVHNNMMREYAGDPDLDVSLTPQNVKKLNEIDRDMKGERTARGDPSKADYVKQIEEQEAQAALEAQAAEMLSGQTTQDMADQIVAAETAEPEKVGFLDKIKNLGDKVLDKVTSAIPMNFEIGNIDQPQPELTPHEQAMADQMANQQAVFEKTQKAMDKGTNPITLDKLEKQPVTEQAPVETTTGFLDKIKGLGDKVYNKIADGININMDIKETETAQQQTVAQEAPAPERTANDVHREYRATFQKANETGDAVLHAKADALKKEEMALRNPTTEKPSVLAEFGNKAMEVGGSIIGKIKSGMEHFKTTGEIESAEGTYGKDTQQTQTVNRQLDERDMVPA
ncbi:MAG: hypothetical protein FWE38_04340 [Firmicutes bacterium]|nr:hypothetical protein [Bacillota bacterium]